MISINGDVVTEHDVTYGVEQFNTDMTTRVMPCDSKAEAEMIAKSFGGVVVEANVYVGSWHYPTP